MLNYETLLSSYDDKLTLMQWLKKVEAALKDASAVSFNVNKKGDATLTFSIVFEDGSEIESGEIVLQQGESVASAAIVNGHLILTLTNGDELDAGQLLNGDLNVSGNLAATGKITGGEIVENMTGYTAVASAVKYITFTYVSIVKNGNKITLAVAGLINLPNGQSISEYTNMGNVIIYCPTSIMDKIYPAGASGAGFSNGLSAKIVQSFYDYQIKADMNVVCRKNANNFEIVFYGTSTAQTQIGTHTDENFAFRWEETFLLSENMIA